MPSFQFDHTGLPFAAGPRASAISSGTLVWNGESWGPPKFKGARVPLELTPEEAKAEQDRRAA